MGSRPTEDPCGAPSVEFQFEHVITCRLNICRYMRLDGNMIVICRTE